MVGDSVSDFVGKCAAGAVEGVGRADQIVQEDSDRLGPEPPLDSRGQLPYSAGRPRDPVQGWG